MTQTFGTEATTGNPSSAAVTVNMGDADQSAARDMDERISLAPAEATQVLRALLATPHTPGR